MINLYYVLNTISLFVFMVVVNWALILCYEAYKREKKFTEEMKKIETIRFEYLNKKMKEEIKK